MKKFEDRMMMAEVNDLSSIFHPILYIRSLGGLGVLGALGDS